MAAAIVEWVKGTGFAAVRRSAGAIRTKAISRRIHRAHRGQLSAAGGRQGTAAVSADFHCGDKVKNAARHLLYPTFFRQPHPDQRLIRHVALVGGDLDLLPQAPAADESKSPWSRGFRLDHWKMRLNAVSWRSRCVLFGYPLVMTALQPHLAFEAEKPCRMVRRRSDDDRGSAVERLEK